MNIQNIFKFSLKKPLKVYWWRYEYPSKLNFGDELTQSLIERIFHKKVVWAEPSKANIIGAGSIIEVAQSLSNNNNIYVWGSGFIKPGENNTFDNLKFTAVRGKLSLERIKDKKVALGDPGLLTSLAYPELQNVPKKYKVGIVPHYVDKESAYITNVQFPDDYTIIDVLAPLDDVIQSISSCELIISSSLHGLIVSDSFNIPNYWMPFSTHLTGGDYKFNDYYSVFGEMAQPISPELLKTLDVDKLINDYSPKKNLKNIQENLIKAFPF